MLQCYSSDCLVISLFWSYHCFGHITVLEHSPGVCIHLEKRLKYVRNRVLQKLTCTDARDCGLLTDDIWMMCCEQCLEKGIY